MIDIKYRKLAMALLLVSIIVFIVLTMLDIGNDTVNISSIGVALILGIILQYSQF